MICYDVAYHLIKIRTDTIGLPLCGISPNNKIRTNTIGDMLLCSISPNNDNDNSYDL